MFEFEEASQGYDEEMAHLRKMNVDEMIMRLLCPPETEGRAALPVWCMAISGMAIPALM
jgi:hypothetical protein